jgi:macrolide phosphotransferase
MLIKRTFEGYHKMSLCEPRAASSPSENRAIAQVGIKTLSIATSRAAWLEQMDRAKAVYPINPQLWNRWQSWLDTDALCPGHTALIHNEIVLPIGGSRYHTKFK